MARKDSILSARVSTLKTTGFAVLLAEMTVPEEWVCETNSNYLA
jgi:hypothetical protein